MDLRSNLLIKKSDIEKALGITIKKKAIIQDNLKPYLPRKTLNFYECIALFQGISPANYRSSRDTNFYPMLRTLAEKILDGELANSEIHAFDELNGIFDASIDRKSAEIFAAKYGYKWELPPYNPLTSGPENSTNDNSPNSDEVAQLKNIIEQQAQRIADLQSQLKDLSKHETQAVISNENSIVNNDDFSIYGHSSELLKILFEVTKEFWKDAQMPPKNATIEAWIAEQYPQKAYPFVSKTVRQYIATILRPQPKLK